MMKNTALNKLGFEIVENLYSQDEVDHILEMLNKLELENKFGVREFLTNNPEIKNKIFSNNLIQLVKRISPDCNKLIKSIYFNKPPNSNWIVNWHQDLTINLTKKKETAEYKNWRVLKERTVVQPKRGLLESMFTIRIHLDDCKKENGALKVIPGSHKQGIIEIIDWLKDKSGVEKICEVNRGGILIMKPLLLHSSQRTENHKDRRIIHIEFTDELLPEGLNWKEMMEI